MQIMAEENSVTSKIKYEEDLSARQTGILEIIDSLQSLLKTEITSLQADMKVLVKS